MAEANSERVKVKRGAKRAQYDRETVHQILDATFLCHIGFVLNGEARIIPTAYVRIGDAIYVHGNRKNGAMNAILDGQTVCTEVTIIDGLVLSRSAFAHSVNYRSVVFYGGAEIVEGEEKVYALDALIEHYVPGRQADLRAHQSEELDATLVVKLTIDEASAKVRTGPPVDKEEDYQGSTWAGVIPTPTVYGTPVPCKRLKSKALPEYLRAFSD